MTEAAPKKDVRRVWLVEDEANLSAARMAKHRLVEQVRRLVDVTSQLDVGDVGSEPGGAKAETGDTADTDRAAQFMALAAEAEALADRIGALPLIPRMEADGLNASQARRHDILPVERSTITGRANPLAPPVRLWVAGELIRGEAYFTAPYEGPPGRVHGAWVAACFDEVLGCAQGASGGIGYTGTLTIRLHRATPLYTKITYEAGLSHRDGRRIHAWGRCYADGGLTAEATGVFVVPAGGLVGNKTAE